MVNLRPGCSTRVSRATNLPLILGHRLDTPADLHNYSQYHSIRALEEPFWGSASTTLGISGDLAFSSISPDSLVAHPRDIAHHAPGLFLLRCSTETGFYSDQPWAVRRAGLCLSEPYLVIIYATNCVAKHFAGEGQEIHRRSRALI